MTEIDLICQIAALDAQIDALSEEKARLCGLLRKYEKTGKKPAAGAGIEDTNAGPAKAKRGPITRQSSANDKIALYMALFRGRQDIHAIRCFPDKNGKPYYSPTCVNFRKSGCGRPKIKCTACGNGKPLTPYEIRRHMENNREHGVGTLGVYPLTKNDSCRFLAVDFDGDGWMDDITTYRTVCKSHNVPVSVERSRSGRGGHVWIFFDQPVPAAQARRMGSMLLTEAMASRHEIHFTTYDRMFPNQDLLPNGGLGNLIALPFQGGPVKEGNSLFVDENFNVYVDQWAYLGEVKRMSADEVGRLAARVLPADDTGDLAKASADDNEASKPWEKKRPQPPLGPSDLYGDIKVIDANMLYIRKDNASQRALNLIKRLAAFSNPDFYKKQRMRYSTKGIARIISSLDENSEYIGIPRGCKDALLEVLKPTGHNITFDDKKTMAPR